HHEHHLIDVGHQDVLALARGPRQDAVARFDALDEALVVERRPDPHPVAGGDDAALVGGQAAQELAHGAAVLAAVAGLDDAAQAVDAQHAPLQAGAGVHGGHLGRFLPGGALRLALLLDDGPAPRQLALGADALGPGGGVLGEAVLLEAARPAAL